MQSGLRLCRRYLGLCSRQAYSARSRRAFHSALALAGAVTRLTLPLLSKLNADLAGEISKDLASARLNQAPLRWLSLSLMTAGENLWREPPIPPSLHQVVSAAIRYSEDAFSHEQDNIILLGQGFESISQFAQGTRPGSTQHSQRRFGASFLGQCGARPWLRPWRSDLGDRAACRIRSCSRPFRGND